MITSYHRPSSLEEAIALLATPDHVPLGGGSVLSHTDKTIAVVDLQALGLNFICLQKGNIEIGATLTLQDLFLSPLIPSGLKSALHLEAPINLRNIGTVAGALVTGDGRSPFLTALLALDPLVSFAGKTNKSARLGDFLMKRSQFLEKSLITKLGFQESISFTFENVARSPADKPIVCVALAKWSTGRYRLSLGGWGASPVLAMDGPDGSGLIPGVRNATHNADDDWASAEYRMHAAGVLALRCLNKLGNENS